MAQCHDSEPNSQRLRGRVSITQPSDHKETKIQLGRRNFFPLPFMQNKPFKFIVE